MRYYVADAFTSEIFKGNPAGVCVPEEPLRDELMQQIAFENNLSETAFVLDRGGVFDLRWFTPDVEVDLCGHATLAASHVLWSCLHSKAEELVFRTKSGVLRVRREGSRIVMDFPRRKPAPCAVPDGLAEALGVKIKETFLSRDMLVLVEDEAAVLSAAPDFAKLRQIKEAFAYIVTAEGRHYDFVSRFFAPGAGVDEDPVTGSSHSTLVPFWSERLGRSGMTAAQLSRRGGLLYCEDHKERVSIGGEAVCYLSGELHVPA